MDKVKVFEYELSFIRNADIREFTKVALNNLPDYFFEVPASSTGKYHPSYTLGEGGLVRHTKAAVRIAVELFRMELPYTEDEKDLIISALILHDGLKSGKDKTKFTVHEHPVLIANLVKDINKNMTLLPTEQVEILANAVGSHMGKWNTNKYSKIVLSKPVKAIERFVHMADYLASRKCLEFNFEAEITRE